MNVAIEESWRNILKDEFNQPYFESLVRHIKTEKSQGKTIYPPGKFIFNAFNTTPFDKVKVLLLGQDPYHNPQQAHGLSFSVLKGVTLPPSLINIFKELKDDLGIPASKNGDLTHWAEQGVFLLNASLTVRKNEPMSHANIGWATFTDAVIRELSSKKERLVFILWGNFAQEKGKFIDGTKHLIIKSAHPSPLSASRGFFGSKPFSKTNNYLVAQGKTPINWQLPQ